MKHLLELYISFLLHKDCLSIEIAEKIIKSELKDKQAQKKLVVDAMQDKDLN